MKKLIPLLFISVVCFGQNHPSLPATDQINKICSELQKSKFPINTEPGLRIDEINCNKGGLVYSMSLHDYESEDSVNERLISAMGPAYLSQVNDPQFFYSEFRKNKWQIGFLFFDKNESFIFSIVLDTNSKGIYERNFNLEEQFKKLYGSLDKINNK